MKVTVFSPRDADTFLHEVEVERVTELWTLNRRILRKDGGFKKFNREASMKADGVVYRIPYRELVALKNVLKLKLLSKGYCKEFKNTRFGWSERNAIDYHYGVIGVK